MEFFLLKTSEEPQFGRQSNFDFFSRKLSPASKNANTKGETLESENVLSQVKKTTKFGRPPVN